MKETFPSQILKLPLLNVNSLLEDSGELDDKDDLEITWPSVFMLEKSVLFKLK